MSFNDLLADLDRSAFAELADDPLALWEREGEAPAVLAVMVEVGDRSVSHAGMPTIERGTLLRMSAAEVDAQRPGKQPEGGDVVTVNGAVYVLHGPAWRDLEAGGRDWLIGASA